MVRWSRMKDPFNHRARSPVSKPMGKGSGHFVIFVDDFDQSLHFYREVLGMRISDFVNFSPAPGVTLTSRVFPLQPTPSLDRLCGNAAGAQTSASLYVPSQFTR